MKFGSDGFGWSNKTNINTNDLTTKEYIDDITPHVISRNTIFEITIDEIEEAWEICQAGTDSSMYMEMPSFTVNLSDDIIHIIELNEILFIVNLNDNQNGTFDLNFYDIGNYEEFNIYGIYIGGGYDINWNTDLTKAIIKIDRKDESQPAIFNTNIKLVETKIQTLNNLLLNKDLKIINSISLYGGEAIGRKSTALGYGSYAKGYNSHAEGTGNTSGSRAHAEGQRTQANGNDSHAEGCGTIASCDNQHSQGKYNIEDTENKYAHIVGNGTSTTKRSNAHTLDWNGNTWYKGNLYTGGTNQSDGDKLLSTADIYFDADGYLVVTIDGVTKKFTPVE